MPFKKITRGKNKGKYRTPSGLSGVEMNKAECIYADVYVKKRKHTYWVNEYMRQILKGRSNQTALKKAEVE